MNRWPNGKGYEVVNSDDPDYPEFVREEMLGREMLTGYV
jgi:hypothetical protein